MAWWLWSVLGIALLILEIVTPGGLFALFFGLLIPLAVTSRGGLLFPGVFAVGTSIPLMILIGILLASVNGARAYISRMRAIDPYVRAAAAIVLVLAGLNDTLTYWLL